MNIMAIVAAADAVHIPVIIRKGSFREWNYRSEEKLGLKF